MNGRAGRVALGAAAAGAAAAGAAYALHRSAVRRWRASPEDLATSGRTLPPGVVHHLVEMTDGAEIHVVEWGTGPAVVLAHGVTLGATTWAPQFHRLGETHRVIALDQRGHGPSTVGREGLSLERLADDLAEVLAALDVTGAVLVGHSMGGMVSQLLAVRRPDDVARHVGGLVLLSTAAGGLVPGPPGTSAALASALAGGAGRGLRRAGRTGSGLFPTNALGSWITRASFGARPSPADLQLARSLIGAMSPAAMAELVGPLLAFDVLDRIGGIGLPTRVVVGTLDVLTPPRMARAMAARIPGAELVVWSGCGHMTMLERPDELCALLAGFSAEVAAPR